MAASQAAGRRAARAIARRARAQDGELGVVGAAGARRDRHAARRAPPEPPVHVGVAGECTTARPGAGSRAGDPARQALAVPALEDVPQRVADGGASQALGEALGRPRSGRSGPRARGARPASTAPAKAATCGARLSAVRRHRKAISRWGARCRSWRSPSGTDGRRHRPRRPRGHRSCSRSSARARGGRRRLHSASSRRHRRGEPRAQHGGAQAVLERLVGAEVGGERQRGEDLAR